MLSFRPRRLLALASVALFAVAAMGCASMGTRLEPPDVTLIGIQPLPSEGNLEQRLLLKLRVTNPNDQPLRFDGVDMTLDLNGQRLGRALGRERIEIPRLTDEVVELTATTTLFAILRQVLSLPEQSAIDYEVNGRVFLADGPGWLRFSREGELADLTELRRSRLQPGGGAL